MKLAQVTGITSTGHSFYDPDTYVGQIFSRALLFAVSAAGLYFFYQLITGGLAYMSAMGDEARIQQIQKQLINAFLGLLIVIVSYFFMQILQTMTGINVL